MVRPSILAVCALMTSSNLLDCVEDLDCQPERASRRFNLTGGERDWSIAEQRYP